MSMQVYVPVPYGEPLAQISVHHSLNCGIRLGEQDYGHKINWETQLQTWEICHFKTH